jgi:hypothetical protein
MINYDKQFNAKINRIVRDFNRKVTKLQNEGMKYIPDPITVNDLKSTYFERNSLKRRLRQLERFTRDGAETIVDLQGGAKATKWELETLRSDMTYLKKRYTNKINDYGNIIPKVLGKPQAVSYARMGDAKYENLRVLRKSMDKDVARLDQSDYNRLRRKTQAQINRMNRQKYVLWANYFTFLEDIAYKADIDPETLASIKAKLEKMDIDDFIKFFETEKAFSSIIEYYDLQKIKAGGYSDADVETVQLLFDSINQLADEYLHD